MAVKLSRQTYQSVRAAHQPHADDHGMLRESQELRMLTHILAKSRGSHTEPRFQAKISAQKWRGFHTTSVHYVSEGTYPVLC